MRQFTRENAVSAQKQRDEYGITPEKLASQMGSDLRGWVCFDGPNLIAFSMGLRTTGEVQVVAVAPAYEGQGIGKRLLKAVCDWLFGEGLEEIWLGANPDPAVRASGFYAKLGWQRTGKVVDTDDEVLVLRRVNYPSSSS